MGSRKNLNSKALVPVAPGTPTAPPIVSVEKPIIVDVPEALEHTSEKPARTPVFRLWGIGEAFIKNSY